MVGRCSKQKKGNQALWHDYFVVTYLILGVEIFLIMRKRIICLLIMLFAAITFSCDKKPRTESAVEDEPVNKVVERDDRPPITLRLIDGTNVQVQKLKKKIIIILFQPDCDHCQDEAKQIEKRFDAFRNYELYFVSSEQPEVILQFAKDYQLLNKPNIYFGFVSVDDVVNNFGSISTPAIYIYKETGELVQNFDGLVDIDVVVKYL